MAKPEEAVEARLTFPEIMIGATLGVMRRVAAMQGGRIQVNGGTDKGGKDWQSHIVGCLGEMAVAKFLKRFWSATVGRIDQGDIGDDYEVRTRDADRKGPDLVMTPKDKREKSNVPYILVHVDYPIEGRAPVFRLMGWFTPTEGCVDKYFQEKKTPGKSLWYVPPGDLFPMSELPKP